MVTPAVRLTRPLGEGGMGAVWVADHLALSTQVVVKFIAEDLAKHPEARARFSREAAMAAQVKSPHVVQTFDHGITESGRPYIVMELLEGRDLASRLESAGPMAPGEVVNIVTQLARALDRAHSRGIVHRDIKPHNIFLCDVDRSGEIFVKLLDFGIAKGLDGVTLPAALAGRASAVGGLDGNTKTGSLIGTPYYMSPEQLTGAKEIDYRTDLWSVGVVTFEALTGAKPFEADTIGGIAVKVHSEPPPKISPLRPDLSPAVDAWFERACARSPRDRFASAKELAEALADAVAGRAPPQVAGAGAALASVPPPHGARLEAPAATDAGVVRSRAATSGGRGRWVVALGALVVMIVAGFSMPRLLRRSESSAVRDDPPRAAAHADPPAVETGASRPSSPIAPPDIGAPAPNAEGAPSPASSAAVAGSNGARSAGVAAGTAPVAERRATSRPGGPAGKGTTRAAPGVAPPASAAAPAPTASGHDIF